MQSLVIHCAHMARCMNGSTVKIFEPMHKSMAKLITHIYIYIINKTQQSKTRHCITSHYILFQAILFHCIPCIYVLTVTCVTRIWKYINKYLYICIYYIFHKYIYIYNRPHRPNASQARRSASLRIEPRGQQRCSCIQHLRGCMGKDKRMNL